MSTIQPKRLNYTRRDILSYHSDVDTYIKQFIPRITDTSQANTGRLFLSLVEALVDNLNFSLDQVQVESNLISARQRNNILKLAYFINYAPQSVSSASVDLTFSMLSGVAPSGGYPIPAYQRVQTASTPIIEFLTLSSYSIPEGDTSVVANAIQGQRVVDEVLTASSSGKPNQVYTIANPSTPHDYIEIKVDGVVVNKEDNFSSGNEDEIIYTLQFDSSDYTLVIFGDGEFGKAPPFGSSITATYIKSDVDSGNIAANTLNRAIGSIASSVGVTNSAAASGGAASESNDSIKRNASASLKSAYRAVTHTDYETQANLVSGVYTSYAKVAEGARTDIYIMPNGGGVASSYLVSLVQDALDSVKVEGAVPVVHALDPANIYIVVNVVSMNNRITKSSIKQKVRDGLTSALDYTKIKPGRGFTLSDVSGICENIDNGVTVDYADFKVLTRIPGVVKSNPSSPDFTGRVTLTELIGYDSYLVTAVSSSQFVVSKNGYPQSSVGIVASVYTTDGNEISFTLGIVGDTLTIGDTWSFSTSKYRDNIIIGDNEFMQLEYDTDLVIAVFYPGEYNLKTQSSI